MSAVRPIAVIEQVEGLQDALTDLEDGHAVEPLWDTVTTTIVEGSGDVIPIDVVDGRLVGRIGVALYEQVGGVWQPLAALPAGASATSVRRAGDEVVVARLNDGLWRSSGWSTDPATATWSQVLSLTDSDCDILPWGLDAYGDTVLVCEYAVNPRTNSRFAWLSTDAGLTFSPVVDLDAEYPGQATAVHWHAAAIDPWTGRLWLSNGDDPKCLWYSDDGSTWVRHNEEWSADYTVIVAARDGILLGTDSHPDGVFRIGRTEPPPQPEQIYSIVTSAIDMSHVAFRGFRDDAGVVYIAFAALSGYVGEVVGSLTGRRVNRIWRDPTTSASDNTGPRSVFVHDDGLTLRLLHAAQNQRLDSAKPSPGAIEQVSDSGRVLGGDSGSLTKRPSNRNLAVGLGSKCLGSSGVAIGPLSETDGAQRSIAVGYGAKALNTNAVVIGGDANASGTNGVLIGQGITDEKSSVVLIGQSASGGQDGVVGIGNAVTARGIRCVAVGRYADACLLYTSPSPRDRTRSRMPSSA